jgi:hypothetical protein
LFARGGSASLANGGTGGLIQVSQQSITGAKDVSGGAAINSVDFVDGSLGQIISFD